MFVPANPPTKLVQLAQAEAVSAVDDHRVGVRDVDAALDDGGREQDVSLPVDKPGHHLLEYAARHLPVANDQPRLGHEFADTLGHRLDGGHPVVQKENLPAAIQLPLDGVTDDLFIELDHSCLDWQPILRRRLDGAHVPRAGEGHVQRARDRRGGERQHIHRLP